MRLPWEIYDDPVKSKQISYLQDSTGRFDISHEQGNQILIRKAKGELRKRWVDSLSVPYKVKIDLKRPEKILRVEMNDVKCYDKYSKSLPLTLWVISDFDCSVCKELQPIFESIGEKYKNKINFAYVFYSGMVTRSAIAAECAERQGKFWEMKQLLYENTESDIGRYINFASQIGLDTVIFKKDFNDPAIFDKIKHRLETLEK